MAHYFVYRGTEKVEIEGDSIGVEIDRHHSLELTYRRSDGEVRLTSETATLLVRPEASNSMTVWSVNSH